jgi:hypothetical protein
MRPGSSEAIVGSSALGNRVRKDITVAAQLSAFAPPSLRYLCVIAAVVVAAMLWPNGVHAATISGWGMQDSITPDGEINTVTVTRAGATYVITDSTAVFVAIDPCGLDGAGHVATCPAPTTDGTLFAFALGPKNDTLLDETGDGRLLILGEAGDDTLTGGPGGDLLDGGEGTDEIYGGGGADRVQGGLGDDRLFGAAGDDDLEDWGGDDVFDGQDGADRLFGSPGADRLIGGAGVDRVIYDVDDSVSVSLDDQPDDGVDGEGDSVAPDVENVTTSGGDDNIVGSGADNFLGAGDGNDVVAGLGGADTIDAGAGDDILDGGPGPDSLAGGAGDDQIAARDGEIDMIYCGTGTDSVIADHSDSVSSTCEAVDRSPAPPSPPVVLSPPPVVVPADHTPPALSFALAPKQTVRSVRKRGLVFTLRSSEGATVRARAQIGAQIARNLGLTRRRRPLIIGSATGRLASGVTTRVRVKLSAAAIRALARPRSLVLTLRLDATDAASNTTKLTKRVSLKR